MNTVKVILDSLQGCRFHCYHEDELQAAIAEVLHAASVDFLREEEISSGSRIDFLIGTIGLEVKVQCSLAALTRQAHRYLQSDKVSDLIVVTTKSHHRQLPARLNGKPVVVVHLLNGSL
jgi:hypothetical protein